MTITVSRRDLSKMRSLKVKIRPFNQLLKRLPKDRLNPMARTGALIKIIARGYKQNFELDSAEFQVLNRAVRLMLHDAWALNRVFVDHDMDSSRDMPSDALPEWSASERGREINHARKRLESESACYDEIENGMNVVVTAFQSMYSEFLYAILPEPIPQEERYMCAALLPPTVRLLKRKWLPVQQWANRNKRFVK